MNLIRIGKEHKGPDGVAIGRTSTSFPGPLLFPSSLAPGEVKRRGPGNEVGTYVFINVIQEIFFFICLCVN